MDTPPDAPSTVRKRIFKILGISLAVVLLLAAATFAGFTFLVPEPDFRDSPAQTPVPAATPSGDASSQEDEELVPLNARDPDVTDSSDVAGKQRRRQTYNFAILGRDAASSNTDTIILVSYDVPAQKIGMVSVPRDTAVIRTWRKNPKINGTFFGAGPDTLKEEIQYSFGIPIDYYILVDLDAFIDLVNAVNGVEVNIPVDMNYDDPYQNLHIHFRKGLQHLNGQQAMEVSRYRHDNDNPDGTPGPNQDYTDLGRSAMQRQILTRLAEKVISWDSIPKVRQLIRIFQKNVETDLSLTDMLWFASRALSMDIRTGVTQASLEGRGDAVCRGTRWCFVYEEEDILPILNEHLNPYEEDLTEDDLHLIRADRFLFDS